MVPTGGGGGEQAEAADRHNFIFMVYRLIEVVVSVRTNLMEVLASWGSKCCVDLRGSRAGRFN
jgi:hypothetical protein